MSSKHSKTAAKGPALATAVETLSTWAELDTDHLADQLEDSQASKNAHITNHAVQWLKAADSAEHLESIKDTFRSVLHYLKQVYADHKGPLQQDQKAAGIHTIMVLIGEATQKFEKYKQVFHAQNTPTATQSKEYQKLRHFYLTRLAPLMDEAKLGSWILALSQQAVERKNAVQLKQRSTSLTSQRVFIDLESIKNDSEYELFSLRKEDGSRFFNLKLIRSIKLIEDLGDNITASQAKETWVQAYRWLDSFAQKTASGMVMHLKPHLDSFFHEALRHKNKELAEEINKAIMALLLSASPTHLSGKHAHSSKNCLAYFVDFQSFLRRILNSRAYQKLVAYPPQSSNRLAYCLRNTVLMLCRALYLYGQGLQAMRPVIAHIDTFVEPETEKTTSPISDKLMASYRALQQQLRRHRHGPIAKALHLIEKGSHHFFDPLTHCNMPSQLYTLYVGDHRVLYTRMALPIVQEYIHKAVVNEEFKGFLLSCSGGYTVKKHLTIMLQDSTSWRDKARCYALQVLDDHREFGQYLDVAVLAVDTDFYTQRTPYHLDHHADAFKQHFLEHLADEQAGFWFPMYMRAELFHTFFPRLIEGVHSVFFQNKNALSRENRLAFIDICYLLIAWKLVELSEAHVFSYACKDGVDTSACFGGALFMFCNWLQKSRQADDVFAYLQLQVMAPALLWRERAVQPEHFQRLLSLLRVIESRRSEMGVAAFHQALQKFVSTIYEWSWLKGEINWPKDSGGEDTL
jgi:hypothetical protein